jgi:glycosyltransferase involved in cell wall biosynthesis
MQSISTKKILIFSTAYLPFVGGAEVAVKEITDRSPEISFTMITARLDSSLSKHEKIGNIDVYRIGKGNGLDKFRLFFGGVKKAKELGEFDVVWSIMASYSGFAALKFKKKNTKTKFLLTLQEGDSKWHIYKHVWWCWPYFKQIFKQADRIQAISNYLADWAKSLGARGEVLVIPNGVMAEKINSQHKKDDVNRVISVSRLVKKNGLEDLIKAIKILNENQKEPVELKIIGDGVLRKNLENLVTKCGLDNKSISFQGSIPNNKIYNRLTQAEVFVRPSLSEGLGNAFLEAMAVGVPIVGTRVGGIPDFLKDGETGWFCEVGNPKSIAEKIEYILDQNNKEEVNRVITNASQLIKDNYTWDKISDQIKLIFHSI